AILAIPALSRRPKRSLRVVIGFILLLPASVSSLPVHRYGWGSGGGRAAPRSLSAPCGRRSRPHGAERGFLGGTASLQASPLGADCATLVSIGITYDAEDLARTPLKFQRMPARASSPAYSVLQMRSDERNYTQGVMMFTHGTTKVGQRAPHLSLN